MTFNQQRRTITAATLDSILKSLGLSSLWLGSDVLSRYLSGVNDFITMSLSHYSYDSK